MTAIAFYCWRSLQLVSVLVLTIIYQKNVLSPFLRLVPAASSYQRGNRHKGGSVFSIAGIKRGHIGFPSRFASS